MKRLLLILATLFCLAAPATQVAYASYDPFKDACNADKNGSGSVNDTAVCSASNKDPISGKDGILMRASLVLATLGSIAAVIIIVVAGLRFVTANGDANRIASARSSIVGAVIGLVIIAAAESIVILVVKNL